MTNRITEDYVLLTAAQNEAAHISRTIESVVNQTILPRKWVIVSDGSVDGTDDIIQTATLKNSFILYSRRQSEGKAKGFASKVGALILARQCLPGGEYDYIGHLDADLSFQPFYYEEVLKRFNGDPRLGVAGGYIYEPCGPSGRFQSRVFNTARSVAGGIQLFRRKCYEDIGGFVPLELGGEDWCAEIMARMAGWTVRSFPDLPVLHHKPSMGVGHTLGRGFRDGQMDHALGTHPLFEIAKCIRRLRERPLFLVACSRLLGYLGSSIRRSQCGVPEEVKLYLAKEQLQRLKALLKPSKNHTLI